MIYYKINKGKNDNFEMSFNLISSYFNVFEEENSEKYIEFNKYFLDFYKFCLAYQRIMVNKVSEFKY